MVNDDADPNVLRQRPVWRCAAWASSCVATVALLFALDLTMSQLVFLTCVVIYSARGALVALGVENGFNIAAIVIGLAASIVPIMAEQTESSPVEPPSCPRSTTAARITAATANDTNLVATSASYDLDVSPYMLIEIRLAVAGEMDRGEEILLFRNEDPESHDSSSDRIPGRTYRYNTSSRLTRTGDGCWTAYQERLSRKCAAGIDFRYHVVVIDKERAEQLGAIPHSDDRGHAAASIESDPDITFIGSFDVPTDELPTCSLSVGS